MDEEKCNVIFNVIRTLDNAFDYGQQFISKVDKKLMFI